MSRPLVFRWVRTRLRRLKLIRTVTRELCVLIVLVQFQNQEAAKRILDRFFIEGGKAANVQFRAKPVPTLKPTGFATELIVAANFVEVFLAKEGHQGLVGINLLEKIQLPTLPSLF